MTIEVNAMLSVQWEFSLLCKGNTCAYQALEELTLSYYIWNFRLCNYCNSTFL